MLLIAILHWKESQQSSLEIFESNYGPILCLDTYQSADSFENGCLLFLLQPPAPENDASWVGLATPGTRVGDFVCYIPGIERAAIIRQSTDMSPALSEGQRRYMYEIMGCAGLARDRDTARQMRGP